MPRRIARLSRRLNLSPGWCLLSVQMFSCWPFPYADFASVAEEGHQPSMQRIEFTDCHLTRNFGMCFESRNVELRTQNGKLGYKRKGSEGRGRTQKGTGSKPGTTTARVHMCSSADPPLISTDGN